MNKKRLNKEDIDGLSVKSNESIGKLVEEYKDPVYFFVLQLVQNHADAQEVTQDTFLKVIEKIHTLQDYRSFNRWLYRIAYNKAMDVHRKTKINLPFEEEIYCVTNELEKSSSTTLIEKQEFIEAVKQEIEQLSKPLREVAFLRYFEDFNVSEIAEVLGVKEGTVKSRLVSVREQLQPKLIRQGYTPTKVASFSLAPIVFVAYQEILQTLHNSSTSYDGMLEHAKDVSKAAIPIKGLFTQVHNLFSFNVVSVVTIGIVSTLSLAAYTQSKPNEIQVQSILYNQEVTNKTLEVVASYTKDIGEQLVEVTSNKVALNYEVKGNEVIFYASDNGSYEIKVGTISKLIDVTNIDNEAVKASSFSYDKEELKYHLSDNMSGVDFASSYMEYQGKHYTLSKDGVLKGEFLGDLNFVLFDFTGNESKYVYKIVEVE